MFPFRLQMGVHQMGIRAQLLKNLETAKEEVERAKLKAQELEVKGNNFNSHFLLLSLNLLM